MYETLTVNEVLQSMLDLLTTGLDTREGSYTRDLLSAVAVEIWKGYQLDNMILAAFFLLDASGEVIDKRAEEYGLTRKPGTMATATITITGAETLPEDTIVQTSDGLQYLIQSDGVTAKAVEAGTKYNVAAGEIDTLATSVSGVTAITNAEAAAGGTEPETDAELTNRILDLLQNPATSGNANHYHQWAMAVNGVGNAKVYPLWNGNGTVKVLIVDHEMQPATDEIVNAAKSNIEANRPIGATVTVASAAAETISIAAVAKKDGSRTEAEMLLEFKDAVKKYFAGIALTDANVSLSKVGYLLLDIEGVSDYTTLTLDGAAQSVTIPDGSVPVLGEVSITWS
nr:MAG TPA: Baseplate J like protein [Caudoviricetes sp.]